MEQQQLEHEGIDSYKSSNTAWLSLFYRIPRELLSGKCEYVSIPRAPYEALHTQPFSSWIGSEAFVRYVRSTCAKVVWRFFKVPARNNTYQRMPDSITDYSENCPIVQLANEASIHMGRIL